ncbi:MAG: hypothetical protein E7168_03485 [Firmicutes bacterium]|nr:hypothetical protein [Bacillota bacterium]
MDKKTITIIGIVAGVILLVVGAILLLAGNNGETSKKEEKKKYKDGELVCNRVITTPEYEMVSNYHIYSDKEGNLTKNEFVSTTTYTTQEEFNRYYSELTDEAKEVYKIDEEKRTITMESLNDYEVGNGIPTINFEEFKKSLADNGFECKQVEVE